MDTKEWIPDLSKIKDLAETKIKDISELDEILNKSLLLNGLDKVAVAKLLNIEDETHIKKILESAAIVKEKIYGKRIVLFAPLYTGNICSNNCLYCAFRYDNKLTKRVILSMEEIENETIALLKEGHKRILLICGETNRNDINYLTEAIKRCYKVREGKNYVRRINVEVAPMEVEEFVKLKKAKIGTYVCFQETYSRKLYKKYHPTGRNLTIYIE